MRRLFCLAFAVLSITGTAAFAAPVVGQAAPELKATTLDGAVFDLASQRGKVVVINFWATWCPPCREEMPALEAFYQRQKGNGLSVIGISVDSAHDADAVRHVMQGFTFPAALLAQVQKNAFGKPRVLPMSFIVDSEGVLRHALRSDQATLTAQSLSERVSPLLQAIQTH